MLTWSLVLTVLYSTCYSGCGVSTSITEISGFTEEGCRAAAKQWEEGINSKWSKVGYAVCVKKQ